MSHRLLETTDYPTALRTFEWKALWELVDGTPERLNLAHECIDRHPPDAVALRIQKADGARATHTFGALAARWQPQFADVRVVAVDGSFEAALAGQPAEYSPVTAADDLAVFQYTSG